MFGGFLALLFIIIGCVFVDKGIVNLGGLLIIIGPFIGFAWAYFWHEWRLV